jgi:hypothetical protein
MEFHARTPWGTRARFSLAGILISPGIVHDAGGIGRTATDQKNRPGGFSQP